MTLLRLMSNQDLRELDVGRGGPSGITKPARDSSTLVQSVRAHFGTSARG